MILLTGFLLFLAVGAIVGFMAGLVGVGGGVIVVPASRWIFFTYRALEVPSNQVMQVAIGTSLAAMMITAAYATWRHWRNKNIVWRVWVYLSTAMVCGTTGGSFIAAHLPSHLLAMILAIIMILLALYLFFAPDEATKGEVRKIHWMVYFAMGLVTGFASGLLGVGGGVLLVPFLLFLRYPINQVAGTSIASIFPITIVGAVIYIFTGTEETLQIPYGSGFVYWPAFIGIAIGACALVNLGIWVAKHVNRLLVKRCFAILLLAIAVELFFR